MPARLRARWGTLALLLLLSTGCVLLTPPIDYCVVARVTYVDATNERIRAIRVYS